MHIGSTPRHVVQRHPTTVYMNLKERKRLFEWLSVCAVWFCSSKCIYTSYVIDTAHLQYQLSTQEGDVAQKWSGSLNAWKMIVDFKKKWWKCFRVFWYRQKVFYPNFPQKKSKIRAKSSEHLPFYPLNALYIIHTTCLNVLAQFQGPSVSRCWWLTCCHSNEISVKLYVRQFLHVRMCVWFIGDIMSVVAVFGVYLCSCACE